VIGQKWAHYSGYTTSSNDDDFAYGYDPDGNRMYKENLLSSTNSELYHANDNGSGDPEGYDSLNRLTEFRRGTLNGSKNALTGSPSRSQAWSLDALGNWDSVTNDGGSPVTKTFDKQNRITTSGFTHSANGEMRADSSGQTYVYDAWGMIVSVDPDGTTTTIPTTTFTYDALHRRISTDADGAGSGVATTHYYSKDWQVLEDRVGSIVKHAYVMSPVFVDAMVLRDSDTDNDNDTGDYGGISADFDERVYVLNDANFNVTAIVGKVSGTWQVIERFRSDAYGAPTFLDPNWAVDPGGSDFGWVHLHQGGRYDGATKLAHFRWRDLHVELGRWTRQDPLGNATGPNGYEDLNSSPTGLLDPLGLEGGPTTQPNPEQD
jgi:RHS repeat-associated protein